MTREGSETINYGTTEYHTTISAKLMISTTITMKENKLLGVVGGEDGVAGENGGDARLVENKGEWYIVT